jgi:hypothetical protein
MASAPEKPRTRRLMFRLALLLLALLVGAYWLFSQSILTRRAVLSALSDALGADVSASSVRVNFAGRVVIDDLRVRAPGIDGPAGELARVAKVDARVVPKSVLSGKPVIYRLSLDRPRLRLSRDQIDGRLNFASLLGPGTQAAQGDPASRFPVIPELFVNDGVVELGEHASATDAAPASYTVLRELGLSGRVEQSADDSGASIINFRQSEMPSSGAPSAPSTTPAGGLVARGRLSREGLTVTITGLDFADIRPEHVPAAARDLYRQAQLVGRVSEAEISYAFAGDWQSTIALAGVAVNLPIESQPDEDFSGNPIPVPESERGRLLRLSNTTGAVVVTPAGVRCNMQGLLEELPYEVSFSTVGTSPQSAWTVTLLSRNVKIHEQPEILKFAPGMARRRLREFSDPTGAVDASVTISRDAVTDPASPPPPKVRGTMELKGITAAFHKFPYVWKNMTGTVYFDESRIEIGNIRGRSDSGALLTASCVMSPPNDDAAMDLEVRAQGVPIDDALQRAMDARGQGEVLGALFNRENYQILLDAGLVISSATEAQAREALARLRGDQSVDSAEPAANPPQPPERLAEIARLEALLATPVFDLGGRADVVVRVTREFGPEGDWSDEVLIDLPQVGMLPGAFAYPVRATNVSIVQRDGVASVTGGSYAGLRGGVGRMAARVDFSRLAQVEGEFVPDLDAEAATVPIDDLLLFALPEVATPSGPRRLGELLGTLAPEGTLNAEILLRLTDDLKTDYTIRTSFEGRCAAPAPPDAADLGPRLTFQELDGIAEVTPDSVSITAHAGLASLDDPHAAPLTLRLDLARDQPEDAMTGSATIQAKRLDLASPIEDAVRVLLPEQAERIASLRRERRPVGYADLRASIPLGPPDAVEKGPAGAPSVIRLERPVGVRLHDEAAAIALSDGSGFAQVTLGGLDAQGDALPPMAAFDLKGIVLGEHDFAGAFRAVGAVGLASDTPERPAPAHAPAPAPANVALQLSDVRLESVTLAALLRREGLGALVDFAEKARVEGDFDATLSLVRAPRSDRTSVTGRIQPRAVSFTTDAGRVDFVRCEGALLLREEAAGAFDELRLIAPSWELRLDGAWTRTDPEPASTKAPERGFAASTRVSVVAESLSADLRAALPIELRTALDELSVDVDGSIALIEAPLDVAIRSDGVVTALSTSGEVSLQGARATLGVPITDLTGLFAYDFSYRPTPKTPDPAPAASAPFDDMSFSLRAELPSFRAANVSMTRGRFDASTGPRGEFRMPTAFAHAHGGRVAAQLTLGEPDASTATRAYALDVECSNVSLAPLLQDMRAASQSPRGAPAPADQPSGELPPPPELRPPQRDASRGVLSGRIALSGASPVGRAPADRSAPRAAPLDQRGRGTMTITGGNVLDIPVLVPIARFTNLQLPLQEKLDHAFADFFLQGDRVSFEQLAVSSESVGLYGVGTATWPAMDLDLRLKLGNRARIPILTPLLEGLREEITTTVVTGPIDNPRIATERFSATRAALSDLFGADPGESQRYLRAMERGISGSERRERPKPLPPIPPTRADADP